METIWGYGINKLGCQHRDYIGINTFWKDTSKRNIGISKKVDIDDKVEVYRKMQMTTIL